MSKKETIQQSASRDTWQTGVTDPPRKRSGLIAGLFMAVIFLCGIVTALSAMNIKLFQQINTDHTQERSMSFTRKEVTAAAQGEDWQIEEVAFWHLGFVGREISGVYRNYYGLPQGVYISQVDSNSQLGKLGLQPGDVLVQVNESAITGLADAQTVLEGMQTGTFLVYRAGQQITIRF